MPEPYNYSIDVKAPFESAIQGLGVGQALNAASEKRAEEARQREAQAAMQADFNALATNPNPTGKDYAAMIAKYPSMSEHFKRGFEILGSDKKDTLIAHSTQVYAALNAGKPEIAKEVLQERITALKNSGNEAEAKNSEVLLKLVEANPTAAKTSAGLMLSSVMGADKFADTFTKLGEEGRKEALFDPEAVREKETAELNKVAAQIGLDKANTNKAIMEGRKISAETAKILMETAQLKKTGGLDPAKKFEQEEKLRREYQGRIGKYTEMSSIYTEMQASAADKSGAADVALVTQFAKMLDPGGVVRDTDFANARDTAGLYSTLQNYISQKHTGSFLDEKQRNDFVKLAGQYYKAAEKQQGTTKASMSKVVDSYGLTPENVFGVEEKKPAGTPPPSAASGTPAATSGAVSDKTVSLLNKYLMPK